MGLMAQVNRWLGGVAAEVITGLRDRIGAQAPGRGGWVRLVALLDLLPRPLMALGSAALVGAAVLAPGWFSARLAVLDALPEPVWWLGGAVISLAFGARYRAGEQAFARDLLAGVPPLAEAATGQDAALTLRVEAPAANAALAEVSS